MRVFELARALGVTSKVVLDKCRAEGLELKNHMAALSAGLEATIREWFSEAAGTTAVETSEHVDLGKARAEATKTRRRRGKAEEEAPAAEQPHEAEPPAEAAAAAVAEAPPHEGAASQAPPAEPPALAAAAQQGEPVQAVQPPPAAPQEPPPRQPEEPRTPPAPTKPRFSPAGPRLIPRPAVLKGPTVVRVERPDVIPLPRGRPRRKEPAGPVPPVPAAETPRKKPVPKTTGEADEDKPAKRRKRSPRRRTGRSAEGGELIQEWRNQDLLERSERLAAATGGGLRRHRPSVPGRKAQPIAQITIRTGPVEIEEPITIKNLSAVTGVKAPDLLKKLLQMGVMATINTALDNETAETLVMDWDIELVVQKARTREENLLARFEVEPEGPKVRRAPVVTFLGHVDHGKTSLLDRIRTTRVAAGEAGGITQHIGAYRYDKDDKHVVFLDTPGHEAFTAMRARGANITDVVVLVVAADDGVMPQTAEAISHAKAAGVPIVVALNKIDLPNANIQKALGQLADQGLSPREWGGTVEVIRTSAATGEGIEALLETLSLEAEILELRAVIDAPASGFVIESQLDPGRGAVARLLIRHGTLRPGDVLLAGSGYGRVRQIMDDMARTIPEAGPSTPVEVSGLDEVPEAGDRFHIVDSIDTARQIAEERFQQMRTRTLGTSQQLTLDNLFSRIEAGAINAVPLIIKADVQGSVEAITASLTKLDTEEVRVNILHAAAGGITPGDVALAEASNAIILGFNVVATSGARSIAEQKGVEIRHYRIIYDLIEDIRKVMEEGLAPEIGEEVLGHAEVRQTFKVSRVGTIAGCFVTDGMVNRNAKVRLTRNTVVIEDGRTLESLKRFKDDVREVRAGMECGLKIAGYEDVKEGDVLEFYRRTEKARTL